MKIIVFSDVHLSHRFNQRKFDYLEKLIKSADKVIINGDFWDYFRCNFRTFVKSQWKKLFNLLKEKETIYILGNHDKRQWLNKDVFLFSQTHLESYELKVGKFTYVFKHGHQYAPRLSESFPNLPLRKLNQKFHLLTIQSYIENNGYRLIGKRIYALFPKKGLINNAKMKRAVVEKFKDNEILVAGHSHYAQYLPKERFINVGCISNHYASHLVIEGGKVELVEDEY